MSILPPAVAVAAGLAFVSVVSRIATTRDNTPADLVHQALLWKEKAVASTDNGMRLQYYSMAAALLHAARGMCPDYQLERDVHIDVARMIRNIESKASKARVNLQGARTLVSG